MLKITKLFILILVLAGCSTTQVFHEVHPPDDKRALVYFIRDDYPPHVQAISIIVNGVKLATLSNKDYVAVNVPVGSNSVLIDVFDGWPLQYDWLVDKPEVLYVVLTGGASFDGINWMLPQGASIQVKVETSVNYVPRSVAEDTVKKFGKVLE